MPTVISVKKIQLCPQQYTATLLLLTCQQDNTDLLKFQAYDKVLRSIAEILGFEGDVTEDKLLATPELLATYTKGWFYSQLHPSAKNNQVKFFLKFISRMYSVAIIFIDPVM